MSSLYVKSIENHRKTSRRPWDPWRDAIDVDREYMDSIGNDDKEFLRTASSQTNAAINKKSTKIEGPIGLLHFINNITGTTLHGYLKPRLSEVGESAADFDGEFDRLVDQFVTQLENSGSSQREVMAKIMRLNFSEANG